jgi:hypothetical protein
LASVIALATASATAGCGPQGDSLDASFTTSSVPYRSRAASIASPASYWGIRASFFEKFTVITGQ